VIDRRAFLDVAVLAILAASITAEAQPARVYKLGYLGLTAGPTSTTEAFRQGLRERGWVEGQNIVIEYRWTAGKTEGVLGLAEELVRNRPDIIVTAGNKLVSFAKKAAPSVPIVMVHSLDPVGSGLVASLARPGGNVTGLTWDSGLEIGGKRLELLKTVAPELARVINLWDPGDPGLVRYWPGVRRAAEALSLVAESAEVRSPEDLQKALASAKQQRRAALFIWAGPLLNPHSKMICDFALSHHLPTLSPVNEYVSKDGCLIGYAPNADDLYRRAATYVDKILRGAKPTDLPVEQPTKFELVINMKTAKALGLTIPRALLIRADQVIE
jgi:ABC-type uncharacterized transport system substrate-binding protein